MARKHIRRRGVIRRLLVKSAKASVAVAIGLVGVLNIFMLAFLVIIAFARYSRARE